MFPDVGRLEVEATIAPTPSPHRAVLAPVAQVPAANALWDSQRQEGVLTSSVDVSVAVATERGLITPIVRNADTKTLVQVSAF